MTKRSEYRQRVYQLSDGGIQLVFGDSDGPADAKLLADHDVIENITVTDHVEALKPEPISEPSPAPSEPSPAPSEPIGDPLP